MIGLLLHLVRLCPFLFGGHRQLALENLALRQQLAVYPVLRWQRRRFRDYWTTLSGRPTVGRPPVHAEIKALVAQMAAANPLWGAPRIHGEHGCPQSLAESVRGTPHRFNTTRVFGPCRRPQRESPAQDPGPLPRLLSPRPNAPVAGSSTAASCSRRLTMLWRRQCGARSAD